MPSTEHRIHTSLHGDIPVYLTDGDTVGEHVLGIMMSDSIRRAMTEAVMSARPGLFLSYADMRMDEGFARRLANSVCRTGNTVQAEMMLRSSIDEEEYWSYKMSSAFSAPRWAELVQEMTTLLDGVHGRSTGQLVCMLFKDECREALEAHDTSTPFHLVQQGTRVTMLHVPRTSTGNLAHVHLKARTGALSSCNVVPDDALLSFLSFMNVSSQEFLGALVESGYDPRDDDALSADDTQAWHDLDVRANPTREPLLPISDMMDIMDKAPTGGVPIAVWRMELAPLLSTDWEAQGHLSIRPQARGRMHVGLHDFLNGTGALKPSTAAEVLLSMHTMDLMVDGIGGNLADNCYGLYRPMLDASMEAKEGLLPSGQTMAAFKA